MYYIFFLYDFKGFFIAKYLNGNMEMMVMMFCKYISTIIKRC